MSNNYRVGSLRPQFARIVLEAVSLRVDGVAVLADARELARGLVDAVLAHVNIPLQNACKPSKINRQVQ